MLLSELQLAGVTVSFLKCPNITHLTFRNEPFRVNGGSSKCHVGVSGRILVILVLADTADLWPHKPFLILSCSVTCWDQEDTTPAAADVGRTPVKCLSSKAMRKSFGKHQRIRENIYSRINKDFKTANKGWYWERERRRCFLGGCRRPNTDEVASLS